MSCSKSGCPRFPTLHVELRSRGGGWSLEEGGRDADECIDPASRPAQYEQPASVRVYTDDGVVDDEFDVMVIFLDLASRGLWHAIHIERLAGSLASYPQAAEEEEVRTLIRIDGYVSGELNVRIGVGVVDADGERAMWQTVLDHREGARR